MQCFAKRYTCILSLAPDSKWRRCITVPIGKTRWLRLRHFKNPIQRKTRTWTHFFLAPKSMLLTIMQCGLPGSARIQISDFNSTNCECFKFSLTWVWKAKLGGNFPDTERMYDMQILSRRHHEDHRALRTWLILILEFRFDSSYSLCFTDSSFKSLPHALFSLLELSFLTLGFPNASERAQSSSLNCNPSCTQMSNLSMPFSSCPSSAKQCASSLFLMAQNLLLNSEDSFYSDPMLTM